MTTALERFRAAEVHWAEIGGTRMAYRVFGRGAPLVLVHGWPLWGATYRDLVEALGDDFTCYVPDLPGAGSTPLNPEMGEFFAEFGNLIADFVEALGLESVGMIGHDSGGTIARIAAARLGDRVNAIGLTNTETPGQDVGLVRAFQIASALPGAAAIFKAMLRSKSYRRSKYGFGATITDPELIDGEFYDACIEPLLANVSGPLTVLRKGDLGVVHQLDAIHAKITAPLMCVWGDRDPYFPLPGAQSMVERWPVEARIETIPGKKLFVHEECPGEVARHLLPFLRAHAPTRPVGAVPA